MGCQATVKLGNNLTFTVMTHDPDTGVLTDADAVPAYRIYEDETGAAILNGNMAKLDDANTTGFYSELIACTSGNGFEVGKSYNIYIVATVDSDQGGISYGFTVEAATPDVNVTLIEGGDATDAINAAADVALSDYDPPTKSEMDTKIDALNNLSAAQVNTEADTALSDYDPPTKSEMDTGHAALSTLTAQQVWEYGTRTLTSFGSLVQDIWDKATSALTTAGSIGKLLVDNINATIGSRSTVTTAEVNAEADTALSDYDSPTKAELDAGLAGLNDLSAAQVNAEADTALSDYDAPTKAELDAGLAGLNDLSAAQVNAEADTALADYDAPTKAELDAGLAGLNDPAANDIADAVLKRDWTAVAGEASRSVLNALRFLRNKRTVAGAVLSVKEEDDATEAWAADLTTDPAAEPVTEVDPT